MPHLRLPVGVVGREFMQEDDGCPASCFLEIEADFVAGDGIGHLTFLLIGPVSKIAVNTRGCNEAKSILFPPSNTRGMTPKPIGRRHMQSCSRHAATRNTQTDVAYCALQHGESKIACGGVRSVLGSFRAYLTAEKESISPHCSREY